MEQELFDQINEAKTFLNSKAKDFYKADSNIITIDKKNRFKGAFLTAIIDFERVIRGTFCSGLNLEYVDIEMLKEMFPNACNMFNVDNGVKEMGYVLEKLRNIHAHHILSKEDEELFNYDFSFLKQVKKATDVVSLMDGNDITVGGVAYILLNLLRTESIKALTKKEHAFSMLLNGGYFANDGQTFIDEISHVNLEIDIRNDSPNTVIDSILGKYKNKTQFNGDSAYYLQGSNSFPLFKIDCESLKDDLVVVKKGTLTRAYYNETYKLKIDEPELFIKISNKLPPFALIDFLYLSKVKTFDKPLYYELESNGLLIKLNKPKYYVDKNISVILLPKECFDYRMVSSVVADGLNICFLSLEEFLYTKFGLEEDGSYSSLRNALENTDVKERLMERVLTLRNIAAHGYALGDYYVRSNPIEFTLQYAIDTLYKLITSFKKDDKLIFNYLAARITRIIIQRLLDTKYRNLDSYTFKYIATNGREVDVSDLRGRELGIEHSFYDTNILAPLSKACYSHHRILEIHLPHLSFPLYMIANTTSIKKVHEYADKNDYYVEEKPNKIIIIYTLK